MTLAERLRWNDELKLYSVKVHTAEQAGMILDAMRKVSADDEKDLADIAVDESIFDDANAVDITMFPLVVDGELNMAVGGTTYPFKDILTKEGFSFKNIVNGQALKLWLRVEPEAKLDVDDLEALFEKYGFVVERYDGVQDADEDEDEDA